MPKAASTLLFILLLAALPTSNTWAQLIPWRAIRPLIWQDFQGKKPSHARKRTAATTSSRLHFVLRTDSVDKVVPYVTPYFNPAKSWKKSDRLKGYLMKHEQLHFDITELYARKMRQSFQKHQNRKHPYTEDWQYRAIYLKYRTQWRRYEHKYDRKTNHSLRREKQRKWNTKIQQQLDELKEFESK